MTMRNIIDAQPLHRRARMDVPGAEDQLATLRGQVDTMRARVQELLEGRQAVDMTDEEVAELEQIDQDIDYRQARIQVLERGVARLAGAGGDGGGAGGGRRTDPNPAPGRQAFAWGRDPRAGFDNFGEFARVASLAQRPGSPQTDERLARMAPTTWANTGSGPDGGFLIPPEFSGQVMEYVGAQGSLFDLCEKTPVNHALAWPVDEDAPWSTNGPTAYWEGEGKQITQSKINLGQSGMNLAKLTCICPVTDELMADAAQLGAYLFATIGKKLRWKVDFGVLQGTGAGQMKGLLASNALKNVAKESGQTAATINSTNISKMYSACYGDFRGRATWVFNQDCETELLKMVVAGTSSDTPVYLPSGPQGSSYAGAPFGSILGRPSIPHQACETLGTKGDILLSDFSQYLIGYKTLGPNLSTSMHLWFDYDLTAVKAVWRLMGMPRWSKTISARTGSATYSPYVSLAVRA